MDTVDDLGTQIYRMADLPDLQPPPGGSAELAARIAGNAIIRHQPFAMAEATLATIDYQRCIVVRRGLPVGRANFLIGQMLTELLLEKDTWFLGMSKQARDELTRSTAAWLAAPPDSFNEVLEKVGVNISALAAAFAIMETCAAMRIPEVGGPASIVATQTAIHRRGRRFERWPVDSDVRALAAGDPKNLRRTVIADEPGRVALFAKAS